MSATATLAASGAHQSPSIVRKAAIGAEAEILADIYQEDNNLALWQRSLHCTLDAEVEAFLASNKGFQRSITVSTRNDFAGIRDLSPALGQSALGEDIRQITDMFCTLFELERAGLRLTVLDRAMCPRFHVDRVPCRLVTSYGGVGTEWLPHASVDRSRLGRAASGIPDSETGLYSSEGCISRMNSGDVALLKGELWEGNENAGLVHRSPTLEEGETRLVLTLDFSH